MNCYTLPIMIIFILALISMGVIIYLYANHRGDTCDPHVIFGLGTNHWIPLMNWQWKNTNCSGPFLFST
ncbi:unnamed protein product, partial [Vitis vinifera]|uniref:Uncharacterized protein n=1 Tax=Vitis vinifera TaxID=29760 RepID=D7TPQ7_VITVI